MSATYYYRVKVYVGPVAVAHYAAHARAAGLTDVWEGTEHVYGVFGAPATASYGDEQCLRQRVTDLVYGSPMAAGWRDATILGKD